MDLVEKIFLLQRVELFRDMESEYLARMASAAVEMTPDPGAVLVRKGEPADGLYLVVNGTVELHRDGVVEAIGEGGEVGSWDLVDPVPSAGSVRAGDPSRLLRVDRADFQDLLADHPRLALDLLESLARRARTLVP